MPFVRRSSSGEFSNLAKNRLENVRSGKAQKPGKQVVVSRFPALRRAHDHKTQEYIYPDGAFVYLLGR